MKILITGANGFVGSHLTEKLLLEGHTVFALVRNINKFKIDLDSSKTKNLSLIQGNIDQDTLGWIENIPSDLDSCVHTAGIVHSFDTQEFFRINAIASENLAKKLKEKAPKCHFVLISSLAAAGPSIGETSRSETDIDLPVSNYGKSKLMAEELVGHQIESFDLTIIRPPMVIGPRDQAVLDIYKMVKGRFIILPGINSRSKKYSFVNVFDLVETIRLVIEKRKTGTFFSSHPQVITFDDMIQKIKKLFGYNFLIYIPLPLFIAKLAASLLFVIYRVVNHDVRLTPDKYHELAANNFTCSGKKTIDTLNQKYKHDIDDTIKMAFDYYKDQKQI